MLGRSREIKKQALPRAPVCASDHPARADCSWSGAETLRSASSPCFSSSPSRARLGGSAGRSASPRLPRGRVHRRLQRAPPHRRTCPAHTRDRATLALCVFWRVPLRHASSQCGFRAVGPLAREWQAPGTKGLNKPCLCASSVCEAEVTPPHTLRSSSPGTHTLELSSYLTRVGVAQPDTKPLARKKRMGCEPTVSRRDNVYGWLMSSRNRFRH
jgi:hypothetical protein